MEKLQQQLRSVSSIFSKAKIDPTISNVILLKFISNSASLGIR